VSGFSARETWAGPGFSRVGALRRRASSPPREGRPRQEAEYGRGRSNQPPRAG